VGLVAEMALGFESVFNQRRTVASLRAKTTASEMTFDLEAAKRLAELLAGDVLNQIERDGSINRENIAGQLLAALVLEAARELKGNVPKRAGLAGISEEFPLTVAKQPPTEYRVITGRPGDGAVHLLCCCNECKRRRKLSLCGCEMCAHHSEAAAIVAGEAQAEQRANRKEVWDAGKEYLAKLATRRAMREMYVQDVQTVDVQLWRIQNGERVHVAANKDLICALRGAIEDNSPHEMVNPDQVVFPNGRVMSGLEVFQTGRTPAQIWEAYRGWAPDKANPTQTRDS
jgi:hypothetical protein